MSENRFQIEKHFDTVAQDYDQHAYVSNYAGKELLLRQQLLNSKARAVLDLGAGTGQFLRALSQSYPEARISALDLSATSIEVSKKKGRWWQRLKSPYDYYQADALSIPMRDESVDMVFSNQLLPYIQKPVELFHELQRIMQPDAVLSFSSLGPDSLKELQSILAELDSEPRWSDEGGIFFGYLVDMHILGDELLQAGFSEPVLDVEHLCLEFPSFDALWNELIKAGLIWGNDLPALKPYIKLKYQAFRKADTWPVSIELVYAHAWANSNQVLKEKAEFQRDGVFTFPIEQLKRR